MKNQQKSYLFAILSVFFWSTAGSAFKITLRYVNSYQMVLYASFVSLLVLFTFILCSGNIKQTIRVTVKGLTKSALLGFLNPFLYYILLLQAYHLLLAQEAVVLNYLWPIILVLFSIPLLKQKISIYSLLALIISFLGTLIIATGGNLLSIHFSNARGVLLVLSTTVIWAIYWILNMKDQREEINKLFWNFCFGCLYILLFSTFHGNFIIKCTEGLLGITYIGMFEMGITYVLWLKALKYSTTTARISNLIYLSPFLSLIFVHFTVGEKIFTSTIIGLILIITGILFQQYQQLKILRKGG